MFLLQIGLFGRIDYATKGITFLVFITLSF
nr:MAG TPA: hypothetical protein [Caudoviricetes sp.]